MTAPVTDELRQCLRDRRPVFGAWTSLGHASITEIFSDAGVAFVGIDLEHSTITQAEAQRIIAAAHAGDFGRYVQTWNERSIILIQIESIAGVEAVDDLVAHDAVDGAMVGPYDLS